MPRAAAALAAVHALHRSGLAACRTRAGRVKTVCRTRAGRVQAACRCPPLPAPLALAALAAWAGLPLTRESRPSTGTRHTAQAHGTPHRDTPLTLTLTLTLTPTL